MYAVFLLLDFATWWSSYCNHFFVGLAHVEVRNCYCHTAYLRRRFNCAMEVGALGQTSSSDVHLLH